MHFRNDLQLIVDYNKPGRKYGSLQGKQLLSDFKLFRNY